MNKYERRIYDKQGKSILVDVYEVIDAFGVSNAALQHLIKKALAPGHRGHKDTATDLQDIVDSALRAQQMMTRKTTEYDRQMELQLEHSC